jgi:hypothetical protein
MAAPSAGPGGHWPSGPDSWSSGSKTKACRGSAQEPKRPGQKRSTPITQDGCSSGADSRPDSGWACKCTAGDARTSARAASSSATYSGASAASAIAATYSAASVASAIAATYSAASVASAIAATFSAASVASAIAAPDPAASAASAIAAPDPAASPASGRRPSGTCRTRMGSAAASTTKTTASRATGFWQEGRGPSREFIRWSDCRDECGRTAGAYASAAPAWNTAARSGQSTGTCPSAANAACARRRD